MSHPNQAGSDSDNDEAGNSRLPPFIEAARSLLFLSTPQVPTRDPTEEAAEALLLLNPPAHNSVETPQLRGRSYGTRSDTLNLQNLNDALNLSVNPPARDPPPPYPGVGRGNLTTNESLATLESVASAVRNLDGKLNDVRDSLKNEIKSVDEKLSDIQKLMENLPNILEGIVSKDDGGKKR